MKKEASTSDLPEAADPAKTKKAFKASVETKQVDLVRGDSSKQVTIGSAWMTNRKARSSSSSVRTGTSLHGSSADMPGVPRELAEHSLNVNKGAKPVKQGARHFGEKKRRAIGAEIAKLQEAKFIREIVHTEWLANPVLVPKPNKDLRMCIDYTGDTSILHHYFVS